MDVRLVLLMRINQKAILSSRLTGDIVQKTHSSRLIPFYMEKKKKKKSSLFFFWLYRFFYEFRKI